MLRITNASALLLAILIAATVPSAAQRPYQKFWQKKLAEQKAPVIIEDNAPKLNPEAERFLPPEQTGAPESGTYFAPSTTVPQPDFVGDGERAYANALLQSEQGADTNAMRAMKDMLKDKSASHWMRLRAADYALSVGDSARAETIAREVLKENPKSVPALMRLADVALKKRDTKRSQELLERAIIIQPNNMSALETLARISYEIDRNMEATRDYSARILLVNDRNPNALLLNAEANALLRDMDKAADSYARLIKERPSLLDRMIDMAGRLASAGRNDDARLLYERALVMNPTLGGLRRAWEKLTLQTGGQKAVEDSYRAQLEASPNDLRLHAIYAEFLFRARNFDELLRIRQAILAKDPTDIPSLMDVATQHLRLGDILSAEKALEKAINAKPTEPEIYIRAADAYAAMQNPDRARELFRQALAIDPENINALQSLARLEGQSGNTEKGRELLKRALDLAPSNGPLLRELGLAARRNGERAEAAAFFEQALAARPEDVASRIDLAEIYLQDEQFEALNQLEADSGEVLGTEPRFTLNYAIVCQRYGEYERTRPLLEKISKAFPEDLQSRILLARVHMRADEADAALKLLEKLPAKLITPEFSAMRFSALAEVARIMHRNDLAVDYLERAGAPTSNEPGDRQDYISALIAAGEQKKARAVLDDALATFRTTRPQEALILEAQITRALGDNKAAIKLLEDALAKEPTNTNLKFEIALAASEAQDIALAEKHYRDLINSAPAGENSFYETSSNNLGYLFAQKNVRLDEAEALIRQALAQNQEAAYILDSLGWVKFQQGDFKEAQRLLEKASRRSFRDAEVSQQLGQLYEKLNDPKQARAMYERALREDPKSKIARERLNILKKK